LLKKTRKEIGYSNHNRGEQKMKHLETKEQGRYLYCVAKNNEQTSLGKIGIDNNEVYTIPNNGLTAVVHNCKAEPYDSKEEKKVKNWVRAHQNVIEKAQEKFETVLPLSFDTIINGKNADKEVINWLQADRERLERNLEKIKGKEEYGIHLIWEPRIMENVLSRRKEEIKNLVKDAEEVSKGKAYFIKQKIKKQLKQELEKLADEKIRQFYAGIKKHCVEIKVEKSKKIEREKEMLMNLSCLVEKDKAKELGKELDTINKLDGFSVRFTGPWPPYSFVS